MNILLVEDETRMADALAQLLRNQNYDVDVCYDGNAGLESMLSGIYDAAVLDVMLPFIDGFTLIETVRKSGITTPTLLLTAKGEVADKVRGLDSGADDYLAKPFDTNELLARIRALCRRNTPNSDGKFAAGDIELDRLSALLRCKETGQEVRLSEKEFHIMEYLIANSRRIVSREQLAVKIWGYNSNAEYNNVEVYISFTRKKLAFIGARTEIKFVRGLGYELRTDNV